MTPDQVKHVEIVQQVINRLSSNSFSFKTWSIGISSALFVAGFSLGSPYPFLFALVPILSFWILDSYYMQTERRYRKLYDRIRLMSDEEWGSNPFSMELKFAHDSYLFWPRVFVSKTLLLFYLPLAIAMVAALIAWFAYQS